MTSETVTERSLARYYPIYDIMRIVLALMIVAIHTSLWPRVLYPWLRLAVPIFFMLSSYLLFSKMKTVGKEDEPAILRRFVVRNLRFYLFWFVALLPITAYCRNFFSDGIAIGIMKFLRALLFSSTFISSWFISALVIGTVIVYLMSLRHGNGITLLLCATAFLLVCLRSSYWWTVPQDSLFRDFAIAWELVFTEPFKSFPASLLWIILGKMIAEGAWDFGRGVIVAGVVVGAILLRLEWAFISEMGGSQNDCYVSLAVICPSTFLLVRSCQDARLTMDTTILRHVSAGMYASHASIATIVSALTNLLLSINSYEYGLILFAVTAILSTIISISLSQLSKTKRCSILRYAF